MTMRIQLSITLGLLTLVQHASCVDWTNDSDTIVYKRFNLLSSRKLGDIFDETEQCKAENEMIWIFVADNPSWFNYYDSSTVDFSSYVDINGHDWDYSALLNHFKAPCELMGGVLYSISGSQTCSDGEESDSFTDVNFPYCIGPSCIVDGEKLESEDHFNYCENDRTDFDYEIKPSEALLQGECKEEVTGFTGEAGYGIPGGEIDEEEFNRIQCYTDEDGSETCDAGYFIGAFKNPCEQQGGVLYKFADHITSDDPESNYYNGSSTWVNQPICIGKSCDVEKHIESIILPYLEFYFEAAYFHEGKETYKDNHTFLGYEPVVKPEMPNKEFLLKYKKDDTTGDTVAVKKPCDYINEKIEKLDTKRRICANKKRQIYSEEEGVGPASVTCHDTCGPFCAAEKDNVKFLLRSFLSDTGEERLVAKQCKWLNRKTAEEIEEICSGYVYVRESSIYGQASDVCTRTCNSCVTL